MNINRTEMHTANTYKIAKEKLEEYENHTLNLLNRGFIDNMDANTMYTSYTKCMVDNNLCGEGWAEQRRASFSEKIFSIDYVTF